MMEGEEWEGERWREREQWEERDGGREEWCGVMKGGGANGCHSPRLVVAHVRSCVLDTIRGWSSSWAAAFIHGHAFLLVGIRFCYQAFIFICGRLCSFACGHAVGVVWWWAIGGWWWWVLMAVCIAVLMLWCDVLQLV